jgi:hypothetical protein
MTLDEFRAEMAAYRRYVFLQDAYYAGFRLRMLYRKFDAEERAMADTVLSEWVLSDDYSTTARIFIEDFKIVSALPALETLEKRLGSSWAVRMPFVNRSVRKIAIKIVNAVPALEVETLYKWLRSARGLNGWFEIKRVREVADSLKAASSAWRSFGKRCDQGAPDAASIVPLAEFREQMTNYRHAIGLEAAERKDHYVVLDRLRAMYGQFDAEQRAMADPVLSEWALSDVENTRLEALVVIEDFKIASAVPALKTLENRLASSDAAGASYELERVRRIAGKLAVNSSKHKVQAEQQASQ